MAKMMKPSRKKSTLDEKDIIPKVSAPERSDLLDFVTALEKMESAGEELDGDFSLDGQDKDTFKKAKKKSKVSSSRSSLAADMSDFTDVLSVDDASFAGLKKRMALISGQNDDDVSGKKVKIVEAPLPTFQQNRIDRSVAYDKTVREVSKWAPVIQKNRDADQVNFSEQDPIASISSHSLVATFTPQTSLEHEISNLIKRDGVSSKAPKSSEDASKSFDEGFESLPTVHLDPDQLYKEMLKTRSSKFFSEIRARRQAKIKSKKYRKMLAKEKMKAEADAVSSGNLSELSRLGLLSDYSEDSEVRRERRMKAEMNRARERLTLKTRKVNKWAQDLLNKRHGDADGRLRVLEQIKEKERLRQEIYGVDDKFDEDSLDETDEETAEECSEEEEDFDAADQAEGDAEVQGIFDSVKNELAVVTGRHRFGPKDDLVEGHHSDSDCENLEEEIEKSIIKKGRRSDSDSDKKPRSVSVHDEFDGDENGAVDVKWQAQKDLIKEAFADDDVFSEFSKEKTATVEAEAPKVEDVTLPGWGVWGGAGISAEDSLPKKRFVIHKKGLDPRARLDKNLKHVIINERRIKAAVRAFTVPKVPFPFSSADMHARHIAQPIGKEWNTAISHKKRIQPRVIAKAGVIIKPAKFFKKSKNV